MEGLKKVLQYASEHRNKMKKAIFLILLSVLSEILPYYFLYRLLILFISDAEVTIQLILLNAVGIGLGLYLKTFFLGKGLIASHELAFDTLMGLRKSFAAKMMKLPMGYINKQGVGAYKKNFVDDIEQLELLLAHAIPEGLPYLFSPLIVFITLLVVDWRMALLSLGSIPFGLIPIVLMMSSGIKKMKLYYKSEQDMNKTIVEYISGMEVIKIFNKTTSSFEKYVSNVNNYRDFTLDWYKSSWTYMALYTAVLPCTILLMLPIGMIFYTNGTIDLPTFLFSLMLTMSIGIPLVKLMEFLPAIPNISFKIAELEKTFDGEELRVTEKNEIPKGFDVTYKDVTFGYDDFPVVNNISFTAKNNEVTAIVGESGSGKSTLARLLVHYWDINSGSIKIGGVNINDMSMKRLMSYVSFVSQDAFLFDIPILENIRLGNPEATDEQVYEIAKKAQCHDFILNLSDSYNTLPGSSGDKLSGGERQRITIARAMLKNSPIIILDEATSSTDAESEDLIQEALNVLIQNKTLIVIAHHLSTIVEANQIIVLDKGDITSKGKHSELLKNSLVYKKLWDAYQVSSEWDIRLEVN